FGPFAGVLTLTVYSVGFVAKLLAERIEEIDFGQVEAMRAAGAPYLSTLIYAIAPQILARQIGLSIYQLDSNLRASAVLGLVGAGGIGIILQGAIDTFNWPEVSTVLLTILAFVILGEIVSMYLRKRIL
ncbi:MAG: ABC transporter permease subunit, partial [Sulfitobacter sp. SK025]